MSAQPANADSKHKPPHSNKQDILPKKREIPYIVFLLQLKSDTNNITSPYVAPSRIPIEYRCIIIDKRRICMRFCMYKKLHYFKYFGILPKVYNFVV